MKRTSPFLRHVIAAALVFGVVLALTGLVAAQMHANLQAARTQRLRHSVERMHARLGDALDRPAYGLAGARGAWAAAGSRLGAPAMARYVASRDLPREFPGVLGFGVIERVTRDRLQPWLRAARAEQPGFALRTEGARADLLVIRSIEPLAGNLPARGFDIGSEPMRRAAAERAIGKGVLTLTGPIRLKQAPTQAGALLLAPVFASGAPTPDGTPAVALVYAPIVYARLLATLESPTGATLRFDLRDLAAPAQGRVLHQTYPGQGIGAPQVVRFVHAGRPFEARYQALPPLYAGLDGRLPWVVGAAGLALGVLAALCAYLLLGSRARAIAIAESMTVDLTRLATVARLTRNAVVVTGIDGRIEWANPAFETLSGYPMDQLRGRIPGHLLQFDGTDPDTVGRIRDALARGQAFHGRLQNRSSAGRVYWVDIEIQPMHTAAGASQGFIGVQSDITEALAQECALKESQAFLERTNRVAGVGGWELEIATGALTWSPQTRRLHDVPDDYVPQVATAIQFYQEAARPVISAAVNQALATRTGWDLELPLVSFTGRRFHARAVGEVICDGDVPVRLVGAFQDITQRWVAEQALAHNTRLMHTTLRSIGDAVLTADLDGSVVWLNPAAERLTGWTYADARGVPAHRVLRLEFEGRSERAPCPIDTCLSQRTVVGLAPDTVLVTRDGATLYAIEDSCAPILDDEGAMHGVVMVFNDVTEKRRMAQEMNFRARHDPLTGLSNRAELEARTRDALERVRQTGAAGALVFLDLDHFKVVNDTCGHAAGDHLLRQIADILAKAVRKDDLVCRFGGDEFALVLERCPLDKAAAIAQAICTSIDAHRYVAEDGRRFRVGASIGLVPLDARWLSASTMFQAADEAAYAAKNEGRGRVVLREALAEASSSSAPSAWGARIEAALDSGQFELHGQRLVSIGRDDTALRCEVLLRLRGEDGTTVSPAMFMPAAERYQLASRIDRWVLSHTLAKLGDVAYGSVERVSINLSGQSVGDSEFHRFALRAIAESGVDPRMLAFEITETAAVTNLSQASRFIDDLHALGVQVALDDFGAGAASFGYLRQLHIDTLKIDGQFIKGLLGSPLDESAVRCFADVARVLGVQTVAEHVEDAETAARLREMGVDMAQGYHYHRPEPLDGLLEQHRVRRAG